MPTATELVTLANSLTAFAAQIDTYIDAQPNPYSANFLTLRTVEGQIASAANQVAGLAIAMLAPDITAAAQDLTTKVNSAKATLAAIGDAQKAMQIAATILAVAAAAATGNPFSAASGVAQLASQIQAVV